MSNFGYGAEYENSSMVDWLKTSHSADTYANVPEGHAVWRVKWGFVYRGVPGGYLVIVIVDAETGAIVHETYGVRFG